MKKSCANFLILNLFLSIIAFSFILNIGVVSATKPTYNGITIGDRSPDGEWEWAGNKWTAIKPSAGTSSAANLPPATGTPTSHGYVEIGAEKIGLESSVAPKGGYVLDKSGNWVKSPTAASTSGLGYSVSGILQGALWGLMAYGFVRMVGLDDADTEAAAFTG